MTYHSSRSHLQKAPSRRRTLSCRSFVFVHARIELLQKEEGVLWPNPRKTVGDRQISICNRRDLFAEATGFIVEISFRVFLEADPSTSARLKASECSSMSLVNASTTFCTVSRAQSISETCFFRLLGLALPLPSEARSWSEVG